MKNNLLFILICTVLTVSTKAQNTFLKISNSPTVGGRFVIPNNIAIDASASDSKTITFRIMIPNGTSNNLNFAKIMQKNDTASSGAGSYGLLFGSASTTSAPHSDIRVIATNKTPTAYGNASNTSVASTLNDGNWHHFALVLNDNSDLTGNPKSKTNLYFDAVLIASSTNATFTQDGPIDMGNISDLIFGASSTGGSAVNGMAIDDVRVWNSAFTATQVIADKSAIINATNAPTTSGLLAAYDFESPATYTNVPDITGKTISATVVVGSSSTAFATGISLATNQFSKNSLDAIVNLDANNVLNVKVATFTNLITVKVYDLSGRVIATYKSNDLITKMSLTNLTTGVYIISVTDGENIFSQKIIKY